MHARDESLNVHSTAAGRPVLRARSLRDADLRELAEAFAEDRERVIAELAQLAAALDRPAAGWDEAVTDFESNLQLPEAEQELTDGDAERLHTELGTAIVRTVRGAAAAGLYGIPAQKRRAA